MFRPDAESAIYYDPRDQDPLYSKFEGQQNRRSWIASIALAAGHAITGKLQPLGSYREIRDPFDGTIEYRARTNWIHRLL